jgi:hypothetical protein
VVAAKTQRKPDAIYRPRKVDRFFIAARVAHCKLQEAGAALLQDARATRVAIFLGPCG